MPWSRSAAVGPDAAPCLFPSVVASIFHSSIQFPFLPCSGPLRITAAGVIAVSIAEQGRSVTITVDIHALEQRTQLTIYGRLDSRQRHNNAEGLTRVDFESFAPHRLECF